MPGGVVRPALPRDAAAIHHIAETVRFRPASARSEDGYLVHVRSVEEYATLLAQSGHCFVYESDADVHGFLIALRGDWLARSGSCTDDASTAMMLREGSAGLLLIDQIGLLPLAAGKGVAQQLLAAALASGTFHRATAAIMHQPVRNARSIGFFHGRQGFALLGESAEPPYVWGIYEKRLADHD
jgi:GNAT superfamily N-acetyltransferase